MMNPDPVLARMDSLLEDYLADAAALERNRKPSELFGLKFGPSDDPRHERFARDMAALLSDFAAEGPDSAALRMVLERLFHAPLRRPEPKSAYWMLVAVQGQTRELIPALNRSDAAALAADYERAWPRRARLPVQDAVLKALKKAAK